MNTDLTRQNLFRSSISIISIKPNAYQCEEIDFFKNHATDEREFQHEFQKTEFVNASSENQPCPYGSLLDKILSSTNNESIEHQNEPNTWITLKDQMGCSESESEQIQIPKPRTRKIPSSNKFKVITKSKISQCRQQDQILVKNPQQSKRFQNETKNIPKNYGKAIIAFALKNFKNLQHLPELRSIQFSDFKKQLVQKRKSVNSINGLKSTWMDFKYAKCMRMLSNEFLRRHSLSYIFNSRISNISPHVKHRYKLYEAIKQPNAFSYIKDF